MKRNRAKYIFISVLSMLYFLNNTRSQNVKICGAVVGEDGQTTFSNLLIINKKTNVGIFGNSDGTFCVNVQKSDILIISSVGYNRFYVSVTDSLVKEIYNVKIMLKKLSVELKEFEVIPQRELEQIQKDIEKLGYNKNDYVLSGISSFYSPITYLFQMYNRTERGKRIAAEMENNDMRRALLKELLEKYVDADVLFMLDEEFDDFIDFCNFSDDIMKQSTQYEFIMLVKLKYKQYREGRVINRVPKK
ncbi:MAG: hypothetical protein HND27_10390 [Bacteroidetes bacterium]|jgi:hypothetical protein|nr:hypothetical protein [Flavobacteriales bacterium]MCL4816005.1 hypothetical protein [Flavobacteriales bacterium]NOG96170.1 hypothetical protein [Bacteroidota bacterium]WKZ74337.1 MAG: hypothetical protein QY303_09300 [Vicingaceae bacterium]CAG0977284.1 hypothetical protein FLAV_01573 [Flavobacteriales bacterium]